MADSARMRRDEPVSAAELAQVAGSSDLIPQERMSREHMRQERMSQGQLMQLQAIEELQQQADEFWNVTSDYPLPAKNLYLVRVLLLVVPSLLIVYYFIRVTLFPIGAVPLVYLVMHIWLAMIYRANRSVKLVLLANVVSGVAAAIMTAFFVYALVTVQGLSELVRDTTAQFSAGIDRIVPVDPRRTRVIADTSIRHRLSRLWLEATLRKTALPASSTDLAVVGDVLADPLAW